jgi:predicted alpha/beta-fold hydrolase
VVLHNLTGSSDSLYVLEYQQNWPPGWASVALSWRGCSD